LFLLQRAREISYRQRRACGGELDVDRNATDPFTAAAVENVYWPAGASPKGTYRIYVNHFRGEATTHYLVRVQSGGQVTWHEGSLAPTQRKLVSEFIAP